jgi:D-glycero-D-manno-heptose 1,7-bisphosphate phosphatase
MAHHRGGERIEGQMRNIRHKDTKAPSFEHDYEHEHERKGKNIHHEDTKTRSFGDKQRRTRGKRAGAARPCVFLDRDGTITHESGYINHPDRLELLPGAAAAIRRLNRAGVLAIMVSNQAGVARGYFTEAVLKATHRRLKELLARAGARLDAIYYSPYHPAAAEERWRADPGQMRKPGTGMIRKARADFAIDMSRSWVVGDRSVEVVFAHKAGLPAVFVKTGYGLGEYTYQRRRWTEKPECVAEDLAEAVRWILADLKKKGWRTHERRKKSAL